MYTKAFTIVASALALVLQNNPLQNTPAGGGGSVPLAPYINIVEFDVAVQIAQDANLPLHAWVPFSGHIKIQNETVAGTVISLIPAGRAAVMYHSNGGPTAIAINGGLAGMWIITSNQSNLAFMPVQPGLDFTVVERDGSHSEVKGPAIGLVTTAMVPWFDPNKYSLSPPEQLIYIAIASAYCGGVIITPGSLMAHTGPLHSY